MCFARSLVQIESKLSKKFEVDERWRPDGGRRLMGLRQHHIEEWDLKTSCGMAGLLYYYRVFSQKNSKNSKEKHFE